MPICPDCKRRLRRKHAIDTHLPIQRIKWLYSCGGCFCEFVYHPVETRLEPKQEQAETPSDGD